MILAAGSNDRATPAWRAALKRANSVHPATVIPRPDRPYSMSRRTSFDRVRDGGMTPAARPVMSSTRARKAGDYKETIFVLLAGLLVFGWLTLIRNVRVGLPGDLAGPRRVAVGAGATSPTGGEIQGPTSGVRLGPATSGPN